jgi:hypothetical protein
MRRGKATNPRTQCRPAQILSISMLPQCRFCIEVECQDDEQKAADYCPFRRVVHGTEADIIVRPRGLRRWVDIALAVDGA